MRRKIADEYLELAVPTYRSLPSEVTIMESASERLSAISEKIFLQFAGYRVLTRLSRVYVDVAWAFGMMMIRAQIFTRALIAPWYGRNELT